MKFKDVRTIESILLEYGLKPGAPTPVGDQQSGTVAKTTPKKPTTTPKKDLGSPTVTPGLDIPEPEAPEPQVFKAMDLGDGDEFKDKTGKVVGKVVSKVGDGPQPDKLVVDDGKGEYSFIDPDEEVFIDAPVTEKKEKSGKYSKKNHRKALNKVKPKVRQEKNRFKQLARAGLKEAKQDLFEINFGRKEIVKNSLDASIRCGWEAETIWTDLESQSDDIDNMTLDEVDNNFGGVDYDSVAEGYTEWLYDYKVDDYMSDAAEYWVDDRTEDEDWINDFIDSEGIDEDDWAHHREETLRVEYGDERYEEEGPEELSDVYGYEDENWARQFVEEERMDDFTAWLTDIAMEDDDVKQDAYERAESDYDYDDWINSQWYSMSSFCDDYGIDYSVGGSLSEVADRMTNFISDSSAFSEHTPEYGDYGNTSGTTTEYAVESDSSIDGYGTGAEIISPVFSTPRRMLDEMKKFFEWLQRNDVDTNSSTGLHVTMSYFPEPDAPMDDSGRVISGSQGGITNRVKMAVLLGDQYILSEFNRDRNTYTRSQMADLEAAVKDLEQNPGTSGIKRAEEFLEKHISNDKFRSIHFKNVTDRKTGTKLIEFRIAGGENYHYEIEKVVKAVVRYATVMIAGHTDEYQADYVKALSRLLNKAKQLQRRDVEEVESLKQRYDDVAGHPILDTHKAIVGAKNYLEFTKTMLSAMEDISRSTQMRDPAYNKRWAKSWKDYIENTSDTMSNFDPSLRTAVESYGVKINDGYESTKGLKEAPVKQERSIKAYMKPNAVAPEKRADSLRAEGIRQLSEALGMVAIDVQTNTARSKPNAKSIGSLRSFLKQNEISYQDIDANIKACIDDFNFKGGEDNVMSPQKKINIIRDGIKILFQKDIITRPDYISAQQVEAFGVGLWNLINSKDFDNKKLKEIEDLIIKVRAGDNNLGNVDTTELEKDIKNVLKTLANKREFNSFFNEMSSTGYNHPVYIISPDMIYSPKHYEEFIKYAKTADSYSHPVSRAHNPNMYNDDSYEENSLNKYTMLLRRRFKWLEELYDSDKSKAEDIARKMVPVVENLISENTAFERGDWSGLFGFDTSEIGDLEGISEDEKEVIADLFYNEIDGPPFIGLSSYSSERLADSLDNIVKGETERRDISNISSIVTDSIREALGSYYKYKTRDDYSKYYKIREIKTLMAQRFKAIKDTMTNIDKLYVDNGFASQDDMIQRKKKLDRDAKSFKKKEALKTLATINIPSHSIMFARKQDLGRIRDMASTGDRNGRDMREYVHAAKNVNNGREQGIFFVIPAAHWGPVSDALNNYDRLLVQKEAGNNSQDWRLKNYNKLVDKFNTTYNVNAKSLFNENKYERIDGTERSRISEVLNIEFTGELDGRTGMGDVEDLLPMDSLKNPFSGEPLDKHAAISWSLKEGNDMKMFAAYDWEQYHGTEATKYKTATQKLMKEQNIGFYRAIEQVIEGIGAGTSGFGSTAIMKAAGVETMSGEASSTIMDRANWENLTDYLKIERGVNNQGVQLLKRVAESKNEDNRDKFLKELEGGTEVPIVGMKRFIICIRLAKEYISDNYKESGGNYFRLNPDGSLGDDVSDVYGGGQFSSGPAVGSEEERMDRIDSVTEQDYEKVRSEYIEFDRMMNAGMQNYMVRPDVNRLVDFLKNPNNDENFKNAVLQSMMKEKLQGSEPNDFQGHLALGRRFMQSQNESVFDKFDKLPLQEQIRIIDKSKILEGDVIKNKFAIKQAQKGKDKYRKTDIEIPTRDGEPYDRFDYKETESGSNAHIIGIIGKKGYKISTAPLQLAKTLVDMYNRGGFTDTDIKQLDPKDVFENVPDLNRIRIINKLLADHFPVGDLKKQMLAYEAIPVPQMLTDFRGLTAQAGPDACARGIVRHYVNALSKEEQEKINLNEWSKQHIRTLLKEAPMQLVQDFKNQNQTLLEYNKGATLNKWGEHIAQAAKFNSLHLDDSWFITLKPGSRKDMEADEVIAELALAELEKMDPTKNKQYVMTLVRWYIGNVKKHKQLQYQYDDWRRDANLDRYGEEDYEDSGYPEDYYDLELIADEFDDFDDDFGNYVMNAENLNTFKLEDADQIKTALERYHSMKPQLQPNERDIGRFKTFYRFEDFVDSKMDPELKAEIENEILNRSDVKVLYNGPMGTVTVPKSHEASCELGSGTKWCTATTNNDTWFNDYNATNDLIIYNEKPGNAKYQFHVKLDGIEARDARDRSIPYEQLSNFRNKHPVMSKILKDSKIKAVEKLAHMSFDQAPDGAMGITAGADDFKNFEILLQYNEKRGGGVLKFLDGFYTSKQSTFGLANAKQLPIQKDAKRLVKYALQRKKPWPQMEKLIVALLQKTLLKVDYSNNTHLKRLENFTKIMDGYADVLNPQWKEYNDIKAEMVAGIGAVQDKSQQVTTEWSKQHIRTLLKEAPIEMQKELMNLAIQVADLERDVQSKCANPKLATQCNYASKKLDDYKQKLAVVQDQMLQYTATEKDIDTAIQMGREETLSAIRNYQATVDKLLNKLSDKISGGFDYITFSDSGIEQASQDVNGKKLTVKDKKKQESEVKSVEQIKQALIGYFKDPELFSDNPEFSREEILEFLTAAANGEILSMEDIMTIGTDPNLPEMITFTEVVQTAAERHGNQKYIDIYNKLVDDGLMYQTVANTTSGNVGPGELALLLLAAPAEKGARGDLSVAGKEVEIKSGSYSVGDSKTTAGGKFNSDFVVKGKYAGDTLNKLLTAFFKEKLSKDFKKEWKAFMAKQEKPNTIVRYKLEPARMNLPAISNDSFEYVYNPFFKEQNISRDQFRTLARIFSQATFSGGARQRGGHFYEVVTSLSELHGVKGWYAKQIEEIATSKGINESLLKRLIIALQFQSYYINKGHDQILYINKTNQKITNVTNAKDLVDKFDRGIVVAVKDINLTDTQQTAAHSITAGL